MSTPAAARKQKRSSDAAAATAAQARTLGCGGPNSVATAFGRGGGPAAAPHSLGRGGGPFAPPRPLGSGAAPSSAPTHSLGVGRNAFTSSVAAQMDYRGFPSSASCMDGFPFLNSSANLEADNADSSSPGSWENDVRPPGGFMSYFGNQAQNSHFVGAPIHHSPFSSPLCTNNDASSPPSVECLQGNGNGNIRTEKRIMWTIEEDVRVMSAWIEHSTDSSCGADRGGNQYWGDVVESYNKTTPPLRKRNLKQCKDRWHMINRWTDLFECAYVKARRVFTSGYSDQMWIDAAHNFYVVDNKESGLGPYVLMEVWKMCRDVPKWKTYNEELRNAHKRKSYHLEGDSQEEEAIPDDMPKRPMGQKQAKMAARAANGKNKESGDESGNSKESPVDLDKFAKYSKFQEENHEKRLQILQVQQKLLSEKIEASKIAHLTAQENKEVKKLEKEPKMMEAYLSISSQDTSSMSDVEKAERVAVMKCLRQKLFPVTE
nr:unnamed protein product [Digitaria exilis]